MVTETKVKNCPFSNQPLSCGKAICGDCEVRAKAGVAANQQIAESMDSYWGNLNSGAD